jgi:hypothetical protein
MFERVTSVHQEKEKNSIMDTSRPINLSKACLIDNYFVVLLQARKIAFGGNAKQICHLK